MSKRMNSSRRESSSRHSARPAQRHFLEPLERRALLAAVASISPSSFGLGVGVDAHVAVTFGSAMNQASITNSTFELLDGSNNIITGRISYNSFNKTATFDASAPLQYAQT